MGEGGRAFEGILREAGESNESRYALCFQTFSAEISSGLFTGTRAGHFGCFDAITIPLLWGEKVEMNATRGGTIEGSSGDGYRGSVREVSRDIGRSIREIRRRPAF